MLRLLLVLFYTSYDRLQQTIMVKCYPIKLVLVAAHRLLKTPSATRLVDLYETLLLIDLQERTDVMRLRHQHAVVARSQA